MRRRDNRRRLTTALAAGFLAISTMLQLGCGVLHCTPSVAVASAAAVPSCHAQPPSADAGEEPHEPGEGTGACCVVAPLEVPASSGAIAHAPVEGGVEAPIVRALAVASRLAVAAAIDSGPPRAPFRGAAVPLRV